MYTDVLHFMKACGHEPSHKLVALYHDLVAEEVGELEVGIAKFNAAESKEELIAAKAETLDAICDSIWVLIGLARAMDLPLDWGWDEVAITNFKKIDPELGIVRRDENGKIMKPERWVPPDMVRIIKNYELRNKDPELPSTQDLQDS